MTKWTVLKQIVYIATKNFGTEVCLFRSEGLLRPKSFVLITKVSSLRSRVLLVMASCLSFRIHGSKGGHALCATKNNFTEPSVSLVL